MTVDDDPIVQETYAVVRNDEEQYSIWLVGRPVPDGWYEVGVEGTKDECLAHIDRVWTDLRPRSVREHLARIAEQPAPEPDPAETLADQGPDLPTRLQPEQQVRAVCRPDSSAAALRSALESGYVHLRFTETVGGTELGVAVDPRASDWAAADFSSGTGTVRVVGDLVLDFQPLRCFAEIDLSTLAGRGRVEPAGEAGRLAATG